MWLGSCRAIDVAVKVPVNSRRITAKQLEAFQAEVKIMRCATCICMLWLWRLAERDCALELLCSFKLCIDLDCLSPPRHLPFLLRISHV